MTITIHEVARKLNLSITTVSRALDGYDDVAESTRLRVLETARQMGYSPNQAARQLRRRRSDILGYILPTDKPRFSDPFYAEFISGLGDEAAAQGYDLMVSTAPPDTEREQLTYERWTRGRKVAGLALNRLRINDWRVQYLTQAGFPFVTLERSLDPGEYGSVEVNGQRWLRALVDHLVSLGYQRIAYIGASANLKIQADRFSGYQEGLKAHGLTFDPILVAAGDLTAESGYQAAALLLALPNPPTAITCVNDLTAIGVLHAARQSGRQVGKDLAVTGFDGIAGAEHTQPPLTTVNQPVYHIARRMAQMLAALIAHEALPELHAQIEPILQIRESTIGEGTVGFPGGFP